RRREELPSRSADRGTAPSPRDVRDHRPPRGVWLAALLRGAERRPRALRGLRPGVREAAAGVLSGRVAEPLRETAHVLAAPPRPARPARVHGPHEREDVPRPA